MSLTAIVNLAERLLNNSSSQSERHKLCRKAGSPAASAVSDPNAGDQFTPSQVSEADAGLFQVGHPIQSFYDRGSAVTFSNQSAGGESKRNSFTN